MTDFPLAEILHPVFGRGPVEAAEVAAVGSQASSQSIRLFTELSRQLIDESATNAILRMVEMTSPIELTSSTFVAFVSGLLENERARSLALGSVYAVRVREPPWFRLDSAHLEPDLVSGVEVGSMLGDSIERSSVESIRRSLEVIAANASVIELTLGHVGSRLRVLTFRITDPRPT